MELEILSVKNKATAREVESLAKEIWEEHFTPIIGTAQVQYMLEKYQSAEAISALIRDGYEYYLVSKQNKPVSYFAIRLEAQALMISKLYALSSVRGSGVGKKMLEYTETEGRQRDANKLWLTVNKDNDTSINWYKRRGFSIDKEAKADIGNGFFMDDFIMSKIIC